MIPYEMLIFLRLFTTMILLSAIVIMFKSIRPLSDGVIKDIFKSILYFAVFILVLQMVMVLFSSLIVDEVLLLSIVIMSLLAFALLITSASRIKSISDTFGFENEMNQLNMILKSKNKE
ncbi:hypothetical protein CUJ83_09380 [Methanocella sp. CWC-04]|uniref:Uncharacterized protein n=1 Tax=Methanooceanicella nereidis TaxID=2052831 RepID=A0AAP2RDB3_9EURY|nr:hypothetical protein [Methanocella sp. CWC-04]MCD1295208.1 hypothetical protein [Methanocella sp. CWC-04]